MPIPPNPQRKEQPSTYFVQDRHSEEELIRLHIQDQMLTAGMGGILPEQPDPTIFHQVLDIGCGTGDWLIEAAKTYPSITRLVGIDISERMVDYAQAQAEAQHVSDRVEFVVMDALRALDFPDNSFDLVNQRLGASYLRTWDWPNLLKEMQRVCSWDGGMIRSTEADIIIESTSPALSRLYEFVPLAIYRAGHVFSASKTGLTAHLTELLCQHGLQNIQARNYVLEYRADTTFGQHFIEDMRLVHRTIMPFLRKWTQLPEDYETIYQQMLREIQQPDFVAKWNLLTAWGNPSFSGGG